MSLIRKDRKPLHWPQLTLCVNQKENDLNLLSWALNQEKDFACRGYEYNKTTKVGKELAMGRIQVLIFNPQVCSKSEHLHDKLGLLLDDITQYGMDVAFNLNGILISLV